MSYSKSVRFFSKRVALLALALCACGGGDTLEIRFEIASNVSDEDAAAIETIEVTLDLPAGALSRTIVVSGAFDDRSASLGLPLAGRSGVFGVRGVARIGAREVAVGEVTGVPLEGGVVTVVLSASGSPPLDGGVDAGFDASVSDAGPVDAGADDAGPDDAGPDDAGPDDDAGPGCPALGDCSVGRIDWISTSAEDSISLRSPHTHAVISGVRWAWGDNFFGQLGFGTGGPDMEPPAPAAAPADTGTWASVEAGGAHACGLSSYGNLYCWGSNAAGQLGVGDRVDRSTPTLVAQIGAAWISVHTGPAFTCARNASLAVYCWGLNDRGQVGVQPSAAGTTVPTPTSVVRSDGGMSWRSVAVGGQTACAVTAGGAIECWGSNEEGQLETASSDMDPHWIPQPIIDGARVWTAVAVGHRAACGLQGTRAYCWGHAGSLGAAPGPSSATLARATEVSPGTAWRSLSVGVDTVCGLRTDGVIVCMGNEGNGVLGDGASGSVFAGPAAVAASPRFTRLSAAGRHVCAVTCADDFYCWGRNDRGELGRRATSPVTSAGRTCLSAP